VFYPDFKHFIECPDEPTGYAMISPITYEANGAVAQRLDVDVLIAKGYCVAGANVGETYGSEYSLAVYSWLYEQMGTDAQVTLFAKSRGALLLFNWAVENQDKVRKIVAVVPVLSIASYPGYATAAAWYGYDYLEQPALFMKSVEHLYSPIYTATEMNIPIHITVSDNDVTVPPAENTDLFAPKYTGPIEVEVVNGQAHRVYFHELPWGVL
jgi:hypothetical protein